jgi:N-formylmethionyl-tRNA deformylase
MTVRTVLRMGDPRLLQPAIAVTAFGTPELATLIADMFDTMAAEGASASPPRRSASACAS